MSFVTINVRASQAGWCQCGPWAGPRTWDSVPSRFSCYSPGFPRPTPQPPQLWGAGVHLPCSLPAPRGRPGGRAGSLLSTPPPPPGSVHPVPRVPGPPPSAVALSQPLCSFLCFLLFSFEGAPAGAPAPHLSPPFLPPPPCPWPRRCPPSPSVSEFLTRKVHSNTVTLGVQTSGFDSDVSREFLI